jgi:PAS domain S-box-containing protein
VIKKTTYENLEKRIQELEQADAERKDTEKNLQRSEELLKATLRLTKVGGWEWDVEKQTMFWTNEIYRIHDFQPSEFSQGSLKQIERGLECYAPDDRPVILEAFRNCVENGQSYDLEFPFTTTKGRRIWVRTIAEPIRKNSLIVKVVGTLMDISDLKQAEEAQEKQIIGLEEALVKVKTLSGLLPICAQCKKIRDDNGYWNQIESYIRDRSAVEFSHSICPGCTKELYPAFNILD